MENGKKKYFFRYDVQEFWKAGFDAESDTQALELFDKLQRGDISPEDLDGYWERNIGIDTELGYGIENEKGELL